MINVKLQNNARYMYIHILYEYIYIYIYIHIHIHIYKERVFFFTKFFSESLTFTRQRCLKLKDFYLTIYRLAQWQTQTDRHRRFSCL